MTIILASIQTLGGEAVIQKFSIKKVFLEDFAKFTGKHLCQSLLFNKVAGFRQL